MKKHLSAALAIGLVGGIALAATPSAADSAFEQIITNVGQSSLAVSPDGSRIYTVTAGTGQPGTSKRFDLYNAEGTRLQSYTGYTSIRYLSDMRIGPDGNLWLSDYQSKYLHRMNFEHPTWSGWLYHYDVDELGEGDAGTDAGALVASFAFTPDGNYVWTLSNSSSVVTRRPLVTDTADIGGVHFGPAAQNVTVAVDFEGYSGSRAQSVDVDAQGNLYFIQANTSTVWVLKARDWTQPGTNQWVKLTTGITVGSYSRDVRVDSHGVVYANFRNSFIYRWQPTNEERTIYAGSLYATVGGYTDGMSLDRAGNTYAVSGNGSTANVFKATRSAVPVTGVVLDKENVTLDVGGAQTLTATVIPVIADNRAIAGWSSSNTSVATVAGGVVTAVAPGTATVTVMTVDGGYSASATVTVKQPVAPGDGDGGGSAPGGSTPGGSTPGGTTPETIVYDPGSGAAQNTTTEPVKVADLAIPAKSGYAFAGWAAAPNGKALADTAVVPQGSSVYALWLKLNGTSGSGSSFSKAAVPKISDTTPQVGQKLKIAVGTWKPTTGFKYQWLRGNQVIKGATKATYTVTAKDLKAKLSVRVVSTKSGYMQTFKTSKETKAVAAGKLTTKAVSIKGTAKVGKKLKISFKAWKPSGVKYSYQWYRAGKKIQGATSKTYKVTTADKGKKLTAKVTGIKAGYKTAASTSKAKKVS